MSIMSGLIIDPYNDFGGGGVGFKSMFKPVLATA